MNNENTQSPRIEDRAAGDVEGQREAFESFARDRSWPVFRTGNTLPGSATYEDDFVGCAWLAWQAAHASATPSAAVGEGVKESIETRAWECAEAIAKLPSPEIVAHVQGEVIKAMMAVQNDLSFYTTPTKPGHMVNELQELCGYVENGTSETVTIFQDDATKDWFVKVGRQQYVAGSLEQAMLNATKGVKGEGE